MSKVAVDVLPFLPFLIFLCVDKKWGYRFLTVHRSAELLNGVVKLTVCAYRLIAQKSKALHSRLIGDGSAFFVVRVVLFLHDGKSSFRLIQPSAFSSAGDQKSRYIMRPQRLFHERFPSSVFLYSCFPFPENVIYFFILPNPYNSLLFCFRWIDQGKKPDTPTDKSIT